MLAFGAWVRARREAERLTQAHCARQAGVPPQQWNAMEKRVRRPQAHTIATVARGLGITPDEVMAAATMQQNRERPEEFLDLFCARLAPIIQTIPPGRRADYVDALEGAARHMAGLVCTSAR